MKPIPHVHNDVAMAIQSISEPVVQEMLVALSRYGLAVAVPHMHQPGGGFVPLPTGMMAIESNQVVRFAKARDVEQGSVPVMWRWDESTQSTEIVGSCGLECLVQRSD